MESTATTGAETSAGGKSEPPIFEVGLVLAGAISAGAYTAGVVDFLVQALAEWDSARAKPGTPRHRVVIKVIAGASAGGITGALGAIALARGLEPRPFTQAELDACYPDHYPARQKLQCVLPSLYSTWVKLPAMLGADGNGGLLDGSDIPRGIRPPPLVRSLLDASLLDHIKRAAIEPATDGATVKQPVPYIAKALHLYLTVSNMRGIPYTVQFGRNIYGMQTAGDRVHYVVGDLGSTDVGRSGSWVELDAAEAATPISVKTLPTQRVQPESPGQQPPPLPEEWERYGTAALASSAFPLGLAARQLEQPWKHYTHRQYPLPIRTRGGTITPSFPPGITTGPRGFVFQSVDGGLVNNNPFDYAQYALERREGEPEPTGGSDVRSAIVMVAPFPEPPQFLPEGSPSPALTAIVAALFPTLINQARFRASELGPALDERDYSRYLIAPLRRIPGSKTLQKFAIACGLLGGFGGFLNQKFRDHDFQLGRRNCQQFLRTSFKVLRDNPNVDSGASIEAEVPVIPLCGEAASPVPLPRWPQMTAAEFTALAAGVKQRASAVVPALINAQTSRRIVRLLLKSGWHLRVGAVVLEYVRLAMLADLARRNQIASGQAPAAVQSWAAGEGYGVDDLQAILAELTVPTFNYRRPAGIAASIGLPQRFVERALQRLGQGDVPKAARAWENARWGWTTFERRPSLVARLPLVRSVVDWWSTPAVN